MIPKGRCGVAYGPGRLLKWQLEVVTSMDDIVGHNALILSWQEAERQSKFWKEQEMDLRKRVASLIPDIKEGMNTLPLQHGYELKVTGSRNYNLTNSEGQTNEAMRHIAMLGNEGAFIGERLVSWKPSLSLTEYRKLDVTNPTHKRIKELIDGVLTITDSAPKVEVKPPKSAR